MTNGGRDGGRGAVLVEFALILPILVMLLFGIVEYGLTFNNLNNLRQGTREGARQAVVANVDADTTCTITGATPNAATHALVCLLKDRIGLDPARLRVMIDFPTTNEEGESLVVCSQFPLDSVTGIFSSFLDGKVLTTEVQMRIESANEAFEAMAETPVTGGSWSWCG